MFTPTAEVIDLTGRRRTKILYESASGIRPTMTYSKGEGGALIHNVQNCRKDSFEKVNFKRMKHWNPPSSYPHIPQFLTMNKSLTIKTLRIRERPQISE